MKAPPRYFARLVAILILLTLPFVPIGAVLGNVCVWIFSIVSVVWKDTLWGFRLGWGTVRHLWINVGK